MSVLELNGVSKTFHSKKSSLEVIKNVSLKVEENEIVCLVGPSGGGKSTILNMIAGLIIPDQGIIKKSGKIGYMFQHDLLFEWRTIKKNLTLGLELDHKITKDDEEKVIIGYQVGVGTKSGRPVAREVRALEDIANSIGEGKVIFVTYK